MNLLPICSLCSLCSLHPAEVCSWSYTAAFISYNCGILLSELISSDRHGKSLPAILLLLWAVSKWYLVLWFVWPFSRWTWHCFGGFHCPLHPTLKCCCGFFSLHRTVFTSQCVAAILGWVSPARASGTELWAAMCDRCVVRDSKLHRFSWSGQWHLVTLISHRYRRIVLYLFYLVCFQENVLIIWLPYCLILISVCCVVCTQQNLLSEDTSGDFDIGGRLFFLLALYSASHTISFQRSRFVTLISLRCRQTVLCACNVV